MLFDPARNIGYQARELRRLLERDNRFPGMTAEELIHDPFAMTLAMSEYRAGPLDTPSNSTRRSGNAFFDLEGMLREELYIFERDPADAAQIRTATSEYLGYIYCESDIYNASVCVNWRARKASSR